jgi:hypothetical protein
LADVVKGNPSGPPALATALRFLFFAFPKSLKKALTPKGTTLELFWGQFVACFPQATLVI